SRNNRRFGPESKYRKTSRGTCGYTEEIAKHPLAYHCICIDQQTHIFTAAQSLEHRPNGTILIYCSISRTAPIRIDHLIEERVIEWPHEEAQWMAIGALGKRAQFPGTKMAS